MKAPVTPLRHARGPLFLPSVKSHCTEPVRRASGVASHVEVAAPPSLPTSRAGLPVPRWASLSAMIVPQMVTASRSNAIRRTAVGVCVAWILGHAPLIRGQETVAARLEQGDPAAWEELQATPVAERGEAWHYLECLAALARGEPLLATRLSKAAGIRFRSPRAWLLSEFLELHGAFDPAQRRTGDRLRRGSELAPPADVAGSNEKPRLHTDNPSLKSAERWIEWSSANLDQVLVPFESFAQVDHFGAWPSVLPSAAGRPTEPRGEAERLSWLREQLPLVLARLAGAASERLFGSGPAQGRWLLFVAVRAHADLAALQAQCESLWRQVACDGWVIVWLLELDPDDRGGCWRSELREVRMPLFVITTRDGTNFGRPGFERGGVSLLLDPDLTVRVSVPPGLPLPTLSTLIKRVIQDPGR